MAGKRRKGPVLLEVINEPKRIQGGGSRAPVVRSGANGDAHESAVAAEMVAASSWTGGGRSVRLPFGYVYIAATVVVVLVALGYWAGFARGSNAVKQQFAGQQHGALSPGYDPAFEEVRASRTEPKLQGEDPSKSSQGNVQSHKRASVATAESGLVVPAGGPDPRRRGFNYFRVAHDSPKEAERLARFLSERGVLAMVFPGDRRGYRTVRVVEAGFEKVSSDAARAMRQQILRLGQEWKRTDRGASDLSDCYPEKYDP